ncbi:MAG: glycerophosphodiester phosphodiesterase family protein, partial [Clostridiales bacterium]|nr:glycerophosphodiester phosphodiesterase family protein [Clostridiales bacterium]
EQLARMLRVNPSAFVAPLYGFNMVKPGDYCRNMDAKASHPRYNQIELYPDYVEKCHALGIRVHPWTVDDAEAAKMLADAGCDALITNRPDFIRENLGLAQ